PTPSLEARRKTYNTLKEELLNAKGLVTGKATLKELLMDYADLLEKDKNEIADHLGALATKEDYNEKTFRALLFYVLASPIFKADEIEEVCVEELQTVELYDIAELLSMDWYDKIKKITLDFDTLGTKTYYFGKIVCFFIEDCWHDEVLEVLMDDNEQSLKCIGNLFVADHFKTIEFELQGKYTIHYLELDL
ncbi:hypothetical protein, partial [Helicobacter ailurogastricus]